MTLPFKVIDFSEDNFLSILQENPDIDMDRLFTKQQIGYFINYFQSIQIKTILIEENYIDRDYLEDFSAYYVRCFHKYRST